MGLADWCAHASKCCACIRLHNGGKIPLFADAWSFLPPPSLPRPCCCYCCFFFDWIVSVLRIHMELILMSKSESNTGKIVFEQQALLSGTFFATNPCYFSNIQTTIKSLPNMAVLLIFSCSFPQVLLGMSCVSHHPVKFSTVGICFWFKS